MEYPKFSFTDCSPNRAVSIYLMASYLYYYQHISIISDNEFDILCRYIQETKKQITHIHKHLVDFDSLSTGTGYYIREEQYPLRVKHAAFAWLDNYLK